MSCFVFFIALLKTAGIKGVGNPCSWPAPRGYPLQLAGTEGIPLAAGRHQEGTPCSCLTLKSLWLAQQRVLRGRELNPGLLRDRQEY